MPFGSATRRRNDCSMADLGAPATPATPAACAACAAAAAVYALLACPWEERYDVDVSPCPAACDPACGPASLGESPLPTGMNREGRLGPAADGLRCKAALLLVPAAYASPCIAAELRPAAPLSLVAPEACANGDELLAESALLKPCMLLCCGKRLAGSNSGLSARLPLLNPDPADSLGPKL